MISSARQAATASGLIAAAANQPSGASNPAPQRDRDRIDRIGLPTLAQQSSRLDSRRARSARPDVRIREHLTAVVRADRGRAVTRRSTEPAETDQSAGRGWNYGGAAEWRGISGDYGRRCRPLGPRHRDQRGDAGGQPRQLHSGVTQHSVHRDRSFDRVEQQAHPVLPGGLIRLLLYVEADSGSNSSCPHIRSISSSMSNGLCRKSSAPDSFSS